MPKLTIDGIEVEVEPGTTVIQACDVAGIEIPRFCYHERLSIAGNCRMCLVEMEKSPKPVASCAMPVADGMVIHTNSEMAVKARRGVMEFLLINHPLDCPICDQGGECDLQDQALFYGTDRTRFGENKRAVADKDFGPLIQTQMTRCIHCTRCVRFATEIAGVEEIGAFGRGENVEISSYVGRAVTSELSGNIIDLCPVGALTSKPYAFTARSWELVKTESVDVLDAVGSAIRVDARGDEVMRILPRINEDVNEEWISDKTRFAYDGLKRQRLDRPYVRKDGRLAEVSWDQAFAVIKDRLDGISGGAIAAIAGDLVDCESLFALKGLMVSLGSPHMDCRQDGAKLDAGARTGYIFNTTIAGIDEADACLLIGTNPRWEAPLINARLRRRYLAGGFRVASIGFEADLTYPVESLGAGPETLAVLAAGKHKFIKELERAGRAMLILGVGAVARPDGAAILAAARSIAETTGMIDGDWNGFNLLHGAAGRVGGLDLGFVPAKGGKDTAGILKAAAAGDIKAVYLLGADEIDMASLSDTFVIYQGHHGDAGAHRADVVLPGCAYTEKTATYVNTEGRAQRGQRAVFPPGDAREDWRIIRALSDVLGKTLPFDDAAQLQGLMAGVAPALGRLGEVTAADWQGFGTEGAMDPAPFTPAVENFYMTDAISRASVTMAQCTEQLAATPRPRTGTDD